MILFMAYRILDSDGVHTNGGSTSTAKDRVMQAAEELFMERGYAAITLRDIADVLEIRQASLYYHFPNGKEELYVAVVSAVFSRHAIGIADVLQSSAQPIQTKLKAIADWFVNQSAVNLLGMMHADMPALSLESQEQLYTAASQSIFLPIRQIIQDAVERQEIRTVNPDLITGSFLAILDGIRYRKSQLEHQGTRTDSGTETNEPSSEVMVIEVIDLLMHGMLKPT